MKLKIVLSLLFFTLGSSACAGFLNLHKYDLNNNFYKAGWRVQERGLFENEPAPAGSFILVPKAEQKTLLQEIRILDQDNYRQIPNGLLLSVSLKKAPAKALIEKVEAVGGSQNRMFAKTLHSGNGSYDKTRLSDFLKILYKEELLSDELVTALIQTLQCPEFRDQVLLELLEDSEGGTLEDFKNLLNNKVDCIDNPKVRLEFMQSAKNLALTQLDAGLDLMVEFFKTLCAKPGEMDAEAVQLCLEVLTLRDYSPSHPDYHTHMADLEVFLPRLIAACDSNPQSPERLQLARFYSLLLGEHLPNPSEDPRVQELLKAKSASDLAIQLFKLYAQK